MLSVTVHSPVSSYSDFQASCNAKPKSTERHLHLAHNNLQFIPFQFSPLIRDSRTGRRVALRDRDHVGYTVTERFSKSTPCS